MRFNVIWLDGEGFASYAETFNHDGPVSAKKYLASRVARDAIRPEVSGYVFCYADSALIRNYTMSHSYTGKKTEIIALDHALISFPHLRKKSQGV